MSFPIDLLNRLPIYFSVGNIIGVAVVGRQSPKNVVGRNTI